jgi:hypothetical protein
MIEIIESDRSDEEYVALTYSHANRFAWIFVVSLAFAGNVLAQSVLHDTAASLMLGALCVVGIVARELYLNYVFRGAPPRSDWSARPGRRWVGMVVRTAVIVIVWLIPDISDGRLSGRSFLFAGAVGAGSAAFFWWQEVRTVVEREPPGTN